MTQDEELKAADPDRWLSSRLVTEPGRRQALGGLYLLDAELAKVARAVKDPLMGDIRLAWWREALEVAGGAGAGRHPAIAALSPAVQAGWIDPLALAELAEARRAELEPFADEAALCAHLEATDGALMALAAGLLSPGMERSGLVQAGLAWGWLKTPLKPAAWAEVSDEEIVAHRRHRALDALAAARPVLAALPAEAFPAVAHLALVKPYAGGRELSELGKRLRVLKASLTGRL